MKVLQLGKFYPIKGGVEKVMENLTGGLGRRGIQCDMLCAAYPMPDSPDRKYEVRLNDNARIIVVPTIANVAATMISPALVLELRRLVKAEHYDIIHVHHPDPMAALALFLTPYHGKVVIHWHSDIVKQKTLLRLFMPIQNWMLKRADRIVGTSPVYVAQSDHLVKWQFKTSYLPIGIDGLQTSSYRAASIKARFPGRKVVFSLGRAVTYKGFEYLISATALLPDDYVTVIGGEGPFLGQMKKQAADLGIQNRVFFPGFIPDSELPAWFGACDVFVLSSVMKTEAYAIVQLEAMSCSRPVISTHIEGSGVHWVNAHGESGIIVPTRDSRALADAIVEITSDSTIYSQYCQRARERFERMFTRGRMIDNCIGIYDYVLGKTPHTQQTMLALLRQALWNTGIDYSAFSSDPGLWRTVLNASASQSIYSLIYDVLPPSIPQDVISAWQDHVGRIEYFNRLTERIVSVQESTWKENGLDYALLKGTSLSGLYSNPLHRGCGDIDWYFSPDDWDKALEIARRNVGDNIAVDSDGDISYFINGITVEHHRDWTSLSSRRFRRILGKPHIKDGRLSPTDTLITLNAHILHHILTGCIGIKQFADLAMAYNRYMPEIDRNELAGLLERLSLTRWTALLHSVLVRLTGISPELLPIAPQAPQRHTDRLFDMIMRDGSFGNGKRVRVAGIPGRVLLLIRYCPRECMARYFHLAAGTLKKVVRFRKKD